MNSIVRPVPPPPRAGEAPSYGPVFPPGMPPDPPTRPKPLRAGPIGVLDIGTAKICCLIGRCESDGGVRVTGFGTFASRGVRGGGITDIDEASFAILKAVGAAEEMAQHHLRSVIVNLTCGAPASRHVNLQWPMPDRPINDHDLRRVMQEGRGRAVPEGRETIHVIPLGFNVDDLQGVADPRGLHCDQLTARLHTIDAGGTALRNLVATIERCQLALAELVAAPLASGIATLVDDERELGATLIDMGAGTTDFAVFSEGHVAHTAQIPIGGAHVTNDIARLLSTPVAHAERLKTLYGNAQACADDEREMLPIPLVGEAEHHIQKIPRSQVVEIIGPRLEETFEMVRDRLASAGSARETGNRVVLTGGASQLAGAREMAAHILGRQVRVARPHKIRGLPELHSGPAFSTAAGLLAWASGAGRSLADIDPFDAAQPGLMRRVMNFLRERV